MRALVTGANGFLGRHVVSALSERGVAVRALVRPAVCLDDLGWAARVEVFRADLRATSALERAFDGVDVLVHLAADVTGGEDAQLASTVGGTERLLGAMATTTCNRLVLASSFAVYDWSQIEGTLDESSPLERGADLYARDGYSIAKSWQERVVRRLAAQHGWDLTVLRPGFIWGRDHAYLAALGPKMGNLHLAIGPATRIPMTYVENCADLFALAAVHPRARGATLNVVDGEGERIWSFLRDYLAGTGQRGVRIPIPYHLTHLGIRLAFATVFRKNLKLPQILIPSRFESRLKPLSYSNRRAYEVLGWRPPLTYRECLSRTFGLALAVIAIAFGLPSCKRQDPPSSTYPTSTVDGTRKEMAAVVVVGRGPASAIAPDHLVLAPGSRAMFSASLGPVTWSIKEGARGGGVDRAGVYTAPHIPGTYHVVATSAADSTRSAFATVAVTAVPALDGDRRTVWSPGVIGGIPRRTNTCATVDAAAYSNGSQDASAAIQAALDHCPAEGVVQLSAGTFLVDAAYLGIRNGITLRGAGPRVTTLKRTNGAVKGSYVPKMAEPVIVVGPNRWPKPDNTTSRHLVSDGQKGALSVTVADGGGFLAGQLVLIDEDDYATGAWKSLPNRSGAATSVRIWATDRAVWQKHDPPAGVDDPFPAALTWFSRSGRPIAEIKEVASVSGNTLRFTTPLHITYRRSHAAQATRYAASDAHVRRAGVEDLSVSGGGDGNVRFEAAAYSWLEDVESTMWLGEAVAIDHSFRIEVRGSYLHDGAYSEPGGGGYAISLGSGSAEVLIEDNIVMQANKLMVSRASGAGSVIAYNYVDDAHIASVPTWQEVGINASHMVGSHHVLFEGNDSFNYDADCTHGNAIYHTVLRNHLSGARRDYADATADGNMRAVGLEYGAWWHSFLGNVLGNPGKMTGWRYEDGDNDGSRPWRTGAIVWKLGYDPAFWTQAADPQVLSTTVRHGNFDYLQERTAWDPRLADRTIPSSLYLTQKPELFDRGRGYVWPWVDPTAPRPVHSLPARARYEAGTPFVQP